MKVWNKEVNSCCECYHCDGDYCNITKEFLNNRSEIINNDCPFSKPITKDVIEEFGFTLNHATRKNAIYNIFKNEYSTFLYCGENNYFEISNCHDVEIINNSRVEWTFKGVISNPIELEFILRSVGAIE